MRLTGKKFGKVLCDHCNQPMSAAQCDAFGVITCRICGSTYEGAFFNVADRFRQQSSAAVAARQEQDAQCFFHPGKQAHAVCSSCGRMLCALCDIQQRVGHICPSCINEQQQSGINSGQRSSWAYTQLAWGLLLFSLIVPVIPAVVGAGFAIAALRDQDYCFNTGRKVSLILAVALAILQLGVVLILVLGTIAG